MFQPVAFSFGSSLPQKEANMAKTARENQRNRRALRVLLRELLGQRNRRALRKLLRNALSRALRGLLRELLSLRN
jgi:hypothetical protein